MLTFAVFKDASAPRGCHSYTLFNVAAAVLASVAVVNAAAVVVVNVVAAAAWSLTTLPSP